MDMERPVRVLQVVAGMDRGGIENFIMNVYRQIDRSQVQFDFLYHTGTACAFDEEILALGGRIYRFPMSQGVDIPGYCRFLDAFFTEHGEYRVCHGHYSMFGVFYNHYAKKHGVPVRVMHSHNTSACGAGLNRLADQYFSRMSDWQATARYACSADAGRFLYGKKEFEVCKNGIDCNRFVFSAENRARVRGQYNLSEEHYVIGSVGQFRSQKNYDWFAKPFSELCKKEKSVRFLLVGDGAQRGEIEAAFAKAGVLDRVIFAGVQADPAPFYSALDVFVLPSLFEGFPVCMTEAQTNGLPCLLSEHVPREVALCENVRFLPLSEPERWVEQLAQRPARNRDGAKQVCEAGYDIKNTAGQLQAFYLQASV